MLARYGLAPRKKWGQNFLADAHVLEKILRTAAPCADDCVLEIGPGLGALTGGLAALAGQVVAVEVDEGMAGVLRVEYSEQVAAGRLLIVPGDIMKLDIAALLAPYQHLNLKVVANLPYYITTAVIMRLLESGVNFQTITVMVQKEVGRRMSAVPGTKEYGVLTLAVGYYASVHIAANVPANSFYPRPDVDSAVIQLNLHDAPPVQADKAQLFKLIHAAFAHRRKTLVNELFSAGYGEKTELAETLIRCGLRPDVRGEALDLAQFAHLAHELAAINPAANEPAK
jgi:16S rRNA (adenine1518-N6/adenine1519-N6)-dimethyltransferase